METDNKDIYKLVNDTSKLLANTYKLVAATQKLSAYTYKLDADIFKLFFLAPELIADTYNLLIPM
jgi:hypothetical protein